MKFTEEMNDEVKGKLLVTLTAFGNTNNGGTSQTPGIDRLYLITNGT